MRVALLYPPYRLPATDCRPRTGAPRLDRLPNFRDQRRAGPAAKEECGQSWTCAAHRRLTGLKGM